MNEDIIQKFGYSEMYEWMNVPEPEFRLGRFVQFSKEHPGKIERYHNGDFILGVSTICSSFESDNPDHWKYAYMCNEYGDMYLQKERLAVGIKQYDQQNELSFIKTQPWEHLIQIENEAFKKDQQYIKRTNRAEWIRVNLMGKVIIKDNGECKAGDYCQPYIGKLKDFWGTAVPYDGNTDFKYYVVGRISDSTIMIINKNIK